MGGKKVSERSLTDVFEPPVEDLQLFSAEVGLLNESVEALGSVAHRRQLGFIRCIFFKQGWIEEKVRGGRKRRRNERVMNVSYLSD